jgi:uncharacterized protein
MSDVIEGGGPTRPSVIDSRGMMHTAGMQEASSTEFQQRRMRWLAAALSIALLVWSFFANLGLGETLYVRRNLLLTAALLLVARAVHLPATEVGFGRAQLVRGLRWGAGAALLVATVLGVGLLLQDHVEAFALLLSDQRAVMPLGGVLYQATLRIPLGTALFEEVAFRGVLLAILTRAMRPGSAMAVSSVVFGLWHIPPTMVALQVNGVVASSPAGISAIAGAVLVTSVAGMMFCWLRARSGSLLAPILAHWSTNSLGLLAAVSTQ